MQYFDKNTLTPQQRFSFDQNTLLWRHLMFKKPPNHVLLQSLLVQLSWRTATTTPGIGGIGGIGIGGIGGIAHRGLLRSIFSFCKRDWMLWGCEAVRLWDCETVRLWDCEAVRLWGQSRVQPQLSLHWLPASTVPVTAYLAGAQGLTVLGKP